MTKAQQLAWITFIQLLPTWCGAKNTFGVSVLWRLHLSSLVRHNIYSEVILAVILKMKKKYQLFIEFISI